MRASRCTGRLRWLSIGLLLVVWGCRESGPPAPPEPAQGAWLFAKAHSIERLAADLAGLEGTPAARVMRRLAERAAGCTDLLGHAPKLDALLADVRCVAPTDDVHALAAERAGADFYFALPLADTLRVTGTGRVSRETGRVLLDAIVEGAPEPGWLGLIVPGEDPAGAGVLSGEQSLLHVRLRPGAGLALPAALPGARGGAGDADRLSALAGRLAADAVLGGVWEAAVYTPRPGRLTPPVALALDVTLAGIARPAIVELIAQLEASWPIRHAEEKIGRHPGGCFAPIRILPEFAPCHALTERALVIGWDRESLMLALRPGAEPALAETGGAVVHLDRLPIADQRLRERHATGAADTVSAYPWSRLDVRTAHEAGALRVRIELAPPVEAS